MIILYGSNGSPFASRVRMQIYAKDVPVELRPAALGTPEFQRLNPLGKMPVVDHDGVIVPESVVIAEYLEEAFPSPSLLGATIQERMKTRLLVRTVDLYCAATGDILWAVADPNYKVDLAAKQAELNKGLDALEVFLSEDGYATGGKLSLADCTLVPWLFYGNMLAQGGNDSLTRRPKLSRYNAFVSELDLTKRIWSEMDESFRAFMATWKAQQATPKAS
jgi:glutathione S-transferase